MIALEPGAKFDIKLAGYEGAKKPPTITCRVISSREHCRMMQLAQDVNVSSDDDDGAGLDQLKKLTEVLDVFVLAWKNIGEDAVSSELGDLHDRLTYSEIWDLIHQYNRECGPNEVELKKSLWPQQSETAGSAPSVAGAA